MQNTLIAPIFDPATLADFELRGVTQVMVQLVARGCAGTKVEVIEEFDITGLESMSTTLQVCVYARLSDALRISGGRLTRALGKWIFSSPQVQNRCGCGTSFGFEDPVTVLLTKIAQSLTVPGESGVLESGVYLITNLAGTRDYTVAAGASVTVYELSAATTPEESLETSIWVSAGASLIRRTLVLGVPERSLTLQAINTALWNGAQIDHEIRVYGLANSRTRVDAIWEVPSGLMGVSVRVHEAQTFLSESARFRGIPSLMIATDAVSASHSLTTSGIDIHQISYCMSRGLTAKTATELLLASHIKSLFTALPDATTTQILAYILGHTHPKHRD